MVFNIESFLNKWIFCVNNTLALGTYSTSTVFPFFKHREILNFKMINNLFLITIPF